MPIFWGEQGPFCRGRGTFLVNEFSDSVYGPLPLAWKSREARTEESGEDEEEIGTNGDNSRDIWLCGVGEPVLWDGGGGMFVVEEEVWGKFGDRWGHQWAASLLLGAASSKDLSRFCVFIYSDNSVTWIQSKEMTTEQIYLLSSCQSWSKLELISKLTSGLKRINFLSRALFRFSPFSTSVSVCLSFFPVCHS